MKKVQVTVYNLLFLLPGCHDDYDAVTIINYKMKWTFIYQSWLTGCGEMNPFCHNMRIDWKSIALMIKL
jgi:hypothetical protein